MKPLCHRLGGVVILSGALLAGVLFAFAGSQFLCLKRAETMNNWLCRWEISYLRTESMSVEERGEERGRRAAENLILETERLYHQLVEAGVGGDRLKKGLWEEGRLYETQQDFDAWVQRVDLDLHRFRVWLAQEEMYRIYQCGRLFMSGTVALLGVLILMWLYLRRQTYRADYPLPGLVPICASCHQIRDDEEIWWKVDAYLQSQLGTRFTHSLCPECLQRELDAIQALDEK